MSIVRSSLRAVVATAALLVVAGVLVAAILLRNAHQAPSSSPGNTASAVGAATNAATASPPASEPAPALSLAPAQPAEPPPGECLVHATSYDRAPFNLENEARISTDIVLATVEEVGPARWRTEDEAPPSEKRDLTGDSVMRLLRVTIDKDLATLGTSGSAVVWIPGGSIGCHKFEVGGFPDDVKAGQQFVLFLNANRPPISTMQGVAQVREIWSVEGDVATSPDLGKVTLSDISSAAKGVPKP